MKQLLRFFAKYKVFVIILAVIVVIVLLFTLPFSRIQTDGVTSANLYVNNELRENTVAVSAGIKTVGVSSPQSILVEKRILVLPFKTYVIQTYPSNQMTTTILKEAGVTFTDGDTILSEKYFNNKWLVARVGKIGPDEQVSLIIARYFDTTGKWSVVHKSINPIIQKELSASLPQDIFNYARQWDAL